MVCIHTCWNHSDLTTYPLCHLFWECRRSSASPTPTIQSMRLWRTCIWFFCTSREQCRRKSLGRWWWRVSSEPRSNQSKKYLWSNDETASHHPASWLDQSYCRTFASWCSARRGGTVRRSGSCPWTSVRTLSDDGCTSEATCRSRPVWCDPQHTESRAQICRGSRAKESRDRRASTQRQWHLSSRFRSRSSILGHNASPDTWSCRFHMRSSYQSYPSKSYYMCTSLYTIEWPSTWHTLRWCQILAGTWRGPLWTWSASKSFCTIRHPCLCSDH